MNWQPVFSPFALWPLGIGSSTEPVRPTSTSNPHPQNWLWLYFLFMQGVARAREVVWSYGLVWWSCADTPVHSWSLTEAYFRRSELSHARTTISEVSSFICLQWFFRLMKPLRETHGVVLGWRAKSERDVTSAPQQEQERPLHPSDGERGGKWLLGDRTPTVAPLLLFPEGALGPFHLSPPLREAPMPTGGETACPCSLVAQQFMTPFMQRWEGRGRGASVGERPQKGRERENENDLSFLLHTHVSLTFQEGHCEH